MSPNADGREPTPPPETASPSHFIREIIKEELASGKHAAVRTRFPPEPNGYLHIGHAKAVCIDFGLAEEFGGTCNLRFDDTNPAKEDQEYVDAIIRDVKWLGFDWGDRLYYASDYFERIYDWACQLIRQGDAYVCDLTGDEVTATRGSLTRPGSASPNRDRTPAENLDLFQRMRDGEFPDGSRTLRAKIDMASPNINLRDPIMYRILHRAHHRQGAKWCVYPMYDWAHGLEDSIEGITHSLCSLEYEIHRPLYDWFLDRLGIYHPRQVEFARLNMTHTVMSKRKLLELVRGKHVQGWDDPRMPTLSGMRRRGYPPAAIRKFCEGIGVSKTDSLVDVQFLDHCVRDELNRTAPRYMAVLRPIKVVIENWPAGTVEWLDAVNNPEDPAAGSRKLPFTGELYIDAEDFREVPPPKYYRLSPGTEVRLRYAFFLKCLGVTKDPATGEVVELRCTYDPATRGGDSPDGRKVKATIHWVSAPHAGRAEVRLYDHLFLNPTPEDVPEGVDWTTTVNPASLETLTGVRIEPALAGLPAGTVVQFERLGYFAVDSGGEPNPGAPTDPASAAPDASGTGTGRMVFNRTATLKDTWARIDKKAVGSKRQ